MRSQGEIRHKLKQAQFRHLKRELLKRLPAGEDWNPEEVTQIKSETRAFFSTAPIHEIAQKYPDVAALLWVLGEQRDEPLVVNGSLVGSMDGVMLWADDEEQAVHARRLLDALAEEAGKGPGLAPQSWWQRIFR